MAKKIGFPPQIKYIVGNEACERFSFYGMKSILVVFMTSHLLMAKEDATASYHLFVSACYLLPLLGAWISDRFLGKYRTILYLSLAYCLGHGALAVWENRTGMLVGLGLIAIGSGGIKPCVSAHVGDQFTAKNKHLLDQIFSIFYFSVNFGATFATMLIPVLLVTHGPRVAFGLPGVLMALATIVFWMGRKQYVHVPPTGKTGQVGFLPVFLAACANFFTRKTSGSFFDGARGRYSLEEVEGAKAAWAVLFLFIPVSAFWALYDQNSSSWVLQAQSLDLKLFGHTWEAAQIQAINPLLVLILTPLFVWGVYPAFRRLGFKVSQLQKMSAGMLLMAFSFVTIALIQTALDRGQHVSVAWQGLAYFILTCSEVMISITGLEFAYTQAPRSMKSTIMSFWLLTIFAGNLLAAVISELRLFSGATYFWFFAGLMGVVAFIFVAGASRYREREYLESGTLQHPV